MDLKKSPTLSFVLIWNNDFSDSWMFCETNWFVGDHFNQEVFESHRKTCVHISFNIIANELWIIASSDDTNADEWRKKWTSLKSDMRREGIIKSESQKVADALRQRQHRQKPQCIQKPRFRVSISREGVHHWVVIISVPQNDSTTHHFECDDHRK